MLSLVEKGILREKAYEIVQDAAHKSMDSEGNFRALIENNEIVKKTLSGDEIASLFDQDYYLRFVEDIFKRLDF